MWTKISQWLETHSKVNDVLGFIVWLLEVIVSPFIDLYNKAAVRFGWKEYQ